MIMGRLGEVKDRLSARSMCLAAVFFALSACSQPIVRVQYVPTKVYLAIPAELTLPVTVDLSGATWGSAVGDLKAGLATCDARLAAVAGLKPPP